MTFDLIPAALSILGAILVSRYDKSSYIGWFLWVISNFLWIGWSVFGQPNGNVLLGVLLQNSVFLYTSITGLRRSKILKNTQ